MANKGVKQKKPSVAKYKSFNMLEQNKKRRLKRHLNEQARKLRKAQKRWALKHPNVEFPEGRFVDSTAIHALRALA